MTALRRLRPGLVALALLASGCGAPQGAAEPPATHSSPSVAPSPRPTPSSSATPSAEPALGTTPPGWLGTRVLPLQAGGFGEVEPTPRVLRQRRFTLPDRLPELPGTGFASKVTTPAPADVIARSSWKPGCPVSSSDLSWLRLAFVGFDAKRHTGELLVNSSAAAALVGVFRELYAARFPIEEMRINSAAELTAPPTGDGNDTAAFACRPVRGATTYSQHAYGLAVDVDPFQNPYSKGDLVLPELASSYLDRGWQRPGMITPDGPVVHAFARIGWGWGGSWHSLKDLQHFSANGT